MILQSDAVGFAWEEGGVLAPLEFESLDKPKESAERMPGAELEACWRERVAALEARLSSETEAAHQQIELTRHEVERETRKALAAEMEGSIATERAEVARLSGRFVQERLRYFAAVEREVVSLALAVAARVLHREAALDPMLLRAAVRTALDKVASESSVQLRVPEEQAAAWSEVLAAERGTETVRVTGDSKLGPGDAVLETVVGRVELGVREQLKEIERGFFDLLAKRPE